MQYFRTTQIHDGNGDELLIRREEITADEVIQTLRPTRDSFLTGNHKPTSDSKPLKLTTHKKKAKEAKFFAGKVKGKRKGVTDAQIYETLDLRKEGNLSNAEICEKVGISPATLYRITTEKLTPGGKRVENSPTPTKVGEREIDKKPAMLTAGQYDEVQDAYKDGMAVTMIAFTLTVDTDEVRKAVKCDNYTQYTAKY